MADVLVRIHGKEGAFRLRGVQSRGDARWVDAWSLTTYGLHSARPEAVRRLCGDCTTRLDTGRSIRETCPTCDRLEVTA